MIWTIESFGVIICMPSDSHVTFIFYVKELTFGSEAGGRVKAGTVSEMNSEMAFHVVFKFYNVWQVLEDVVLKYIQS